MVLTAIKNITSLSFTLVIAAAGLAVVHAQTPAFEERLAALEAKVKQLDPGFRPSSPDTARRLLELEKKVEELLASRTVAATVAAAPVGKAEQPAAALQAVSVTGDYRASNNEESRLPVAGYMETHFNKVKGEPGTADFHRFVLLFGHSFSSRLKFWSELEIEHAFVVGGEEKGEVALEQAYLDFLIKPYFNVRAGMLLAPVGIINERHEPPSFHGVERPMVETVIIPSTWFDAGAGITGDLGKGFRYRAYVMGGLDATGFNAEEGLRGGRQSGFATNLRNPAKAGRLEYLGRRGLALGTSFFTGHSGFNLASVNPRVSLLNFDGRYNRGRFDFRGLFADTWISHAGELNRTLQRQFGFNPNVASRLRGWYLEPAVQLLPRRARHDFSLFTRYERFNTQHQMPAGFVRLPQFDRSAWVLGATYKPHADIAVKFDYIFNRNRSAVVRPADSLNIGIGWWF